MRLKKLLCFLCLMGASNLYSQSESTEMVPPSVLFRYDLGSYDSMLLAIGHQPVGQEDSFAGLYYEEDIVDETFSVTTLGVIAFNFSRQKTPEEGAELRIGLSTTRYSGERRKGFDVGLELHKYMSSNIAIGLGATLRPTILAYESDGDYLAEYKVNIGVHYTVMNGLKLDAQYRYDGILGAESSSEYINDGFQIGLSMLF